MHITCPACAAAYEVPDALLAPGRRARCARCGHEWLPSAEAVPEPAPEEEADAPAEAPAEPTPAPDPGFRQPATPLAASSRPIARPSKPPRRQPGAAIWLGWAASLAIVLYAGYAATSHRGAVMRSWPPSIRLYGALGLTTPEAAPAGAAPAGAAPAGAALGETATKP